ncbi:sigma-70 family RNA polymerase sigma factor [Gracilibacillus salinarum]|uniref:Sigma-70 family RNA polymerase sigma factor n=1 Tax=Gracilibacillus salinarum TaxID=2932255 RepID=A0ABY4GL67_9BACI|nr:sigma-70 family RNA polymerase sigma factor [Gracilibacillus salinarum]UOQ84482.1 sigma-70 family RNA polymerase sigma factor [Gracilibacillus salinarum]
MERIEKEELLEEVMIEHGDDLVRLAFHYVKDQETAKDMVQNSFIKCYEKIELFRFDSSLKTWLYRITINQCKDHLKSWHVRKVSVKNILEHAVASILPSTEDKVIQDVSNQEMKSFVQTLSTNYQEVIYLYYYKSFTIAEIAEVTGLNNNTVKTRLSRAKQKLRNLMKEDRIYD